MEQMNLSKAKLSGDGLRTGLIPMAMDKASALDDLSKKQVKAFTPIGWSSRRLMNDSDNGGNNNLNSTPWTVLSYNDATSTNGLSPNSAANNGFVTNIGAFDIAAAQYLYGPNNSYESGDTTYQLSSNLNGYQTIWDAGGTDIIDANTWSSD